MFAWLSAGFLACLALAVTGCSALRLHPSQPNAEVKSVRAATNGAPTAVTLTALQSQVMRFADEYVALVGQAADDFSAKAATPEARLAGLKWKLGQSTAAYVDASGPNPAVNALDILVLVTMARMVVEDYGVETFGETVLPLLATQRQLETNAWTLANGVLKPGQQQELHELIQEWRQKYPQQRYVGTIRFREFATALGRNPTPATSSPTSIFSLLFLDPLAGLDPTAAAIEETRRLGERGMYYSQRMPTLLSWQTEALAYQLAGQPESKQMLVDAGRMAASAESFAKTAGQLPQLVNDQREAAIRQLLDGLDSKEKSGHELLDASRQTLGAASEAALSINTTIKSLDEFVRHVSPDSSQHTNVTTNSKSFDVLDYGRAAEQVGSAAKELQSLMVSFNQSTPQWARLSDQATARADHVLDRAFKLGLALILVLLTGSVLVGLMFRAITKIFRHSPDGSQLTR